jgi:CBS domain-containing protein
VIEIREVMTPSAEFIDANAMIRDAAIKMRDQDLGALPVGDQGRLIGMVTDRDIVVRAVAADRSAATTAVREVMSEDLVVEHLELSGFEIDEEGQAIRKKPPMKRHG